MQQKEWENNISEENWREDVTASGVNWVEIIFFFRFKRIAFSKWTAFKRIAFSVLGKPALQNFLYKPQFNGWMISSSFSNRWGEARIRAQPTLTQVH